MDMVSCKEDIIYVFSFLKWMILKLYRFVWSASSQGNGFNNMNIKLVFQLGPLAQSVERGADNAKVVSSSLTRTKFFYFTFL